MSAKRETVAASRSLRLSVLRTLRRARAPALPVLACFFPLYHFWGKAEISDNFRPDPFPNRNRDAIPDHSVRIVRAADESKCVWHTLEARVFSDGVRSHAMRKSSIDYQSRAQVFRVMRHARRCDVTAFRIADDRSISICAGEALEDVIRNVRSRIWFEYFC